MARFLSFLKSLSEDRVFKEEDCGMAAPSGDVSAPPSTPPNAGDVVDAPKVDGGISSDEVLGKCDHKKDGFFGPGCFHLPYAIFSVPASRIKKKKKKKRLTTQNLLEDEDFGTFRESVGNKAKKMLECISSEIVSNVAPGLHVSYDKGFDFSDDKEDWVSSYCFDKDDHENMSIGLNIPVLYSFLSQNDLENDDKEIECQLKAYLYRELAHCLLKYFMKIGKFDFEFSNREENDVADEYMKYKMCDFTGTTSSKLHNFLKKLARS